jgi:predicted CXXCH cytochrome family protein
MYITLKKWRYLMKSFKLLGFICLIALSQTGKAQQITGSAHDFSNLAWSNNQICLPCHTPHNATTTVVDAPLWNHQITETSFMLYSSGSIDATIGQPDGSSKLCLSCHDGSVAVENFGGVTNGINFVTGNSLIGTDLSGDHPISFIYNTALATSDGSLHDPATRPALGGTIRTRMLISDKMQCSSCHDVHNRYGVPGLLVMSNTNSALCLTCHNK